MTDQLDLTRHYWRGYTRDTDEAEARRLFEARYGQPPAHIIRALGILLAGPIPAGAGPRDNTGEATP